LLELSNSSGGTGGRFLAEGIDDKIERTVDYKTLEREKYWRV
jgi:hypothetical protein